ncbi:MAG: hypothetical protein KGZ96_01595 [Clostridia bacterium]|jgi:hypothetical protein|nr:hypothetical protein [Clostridia bacterium]
MNRENLLILKEKIKDKIDQIWLNEPFDIYALKNGYIPSGAGINDQYFAVLVMLGGLVRGLGIHTFPQLLEFAKEEDFALKQLKFMTKSLIRVDCGVIEYFGLTSYGKLLKNLYDCIDHVESKDEFTEIINSMFTLTNRYQLWLHQIFPWKLSVFFKKTTPEKLLDTYNKLNMQESLNCKANGSSD